MLVKYTAVDAGQLIGQIQIFNGYVVCAAGGYRDRIGNLFADFPAFSLVSGLGDSQFTDRRKFIGDYGLILRVVVIW